MNTDLKSQLEKALQCHKAGEYPEAETLYKEVLACDAKNIDAISLLSSLKIQMGQFNEVINFLEKAVEIKPDFFDFWFNLGLAYKNTNEIQKAINAYNKAIEIAPNNANAHFNLAGVYDNRLNDPQKAAEYYYNAYKLTNSEQSSDIQYLLGISLMKSGDFEEGLKHYEHRLSKDFAIITQAKEYGDLIAEKPFWYGEDIKDKTLFVYYESGLGDTLMYARYLALLKEKCAKVLFAPQVCFIDFFKENNFGAEIIDCRKPNPSLNFDTHVSLMSLPFVLGLNDEIPLAEGYLKADTEKAKECREKYFNNDKFKIGIKWMGNTAYELSRIITIESFYKLFELPNTQFYSLQKGEGIEELQKVPEKYNVIDLGQTFNNFADTAAAIENLDLVICNDTSVAHLAGAMGKPCWILLPYVQNWRWFTDTSCCPWYKSVKLFKQNELNNWEEVFDRVLSKLNHFINIQSP